MNLFSVWFYAIAIAYKLCTHDIFLEKISWPFQTMAFVKKDIELEQMLRGPMEKPVSERSVSSVQKASTQEQEMIKATVKARWKREQTESELHHTITNCVTSAPESSHRQCRHRRDPIPSPLKPTPCTQTSLSSLFWLINRFCCHMR